MIFSGIKFPLLVAAAAVSLSACDDVTNPFGGGSDTVSSSSGTQTSVELVERDVEAPDVFQLTDKGLWDGRPSLGGVWVAHPDAKDPERVIIRNEGNGKFVIGALFRRERESSGPVLQLSSDAADALGILAGQPETLNVTALRKEEVKTEPEATATADLAAPENIETQSLDDPIAIASAAIDEAEAETSTVTAATTAAATSTPAPTPKPTPASKPALDKAYVQIGFFSKESNANATAEAMRQHGVLPTIKESTTADKTYWRVIAGPAASKSDRNLLLKKVKGLGFEDAYFVSN
ncbi:MAG: SPOR domain-containing protein [Pseudoruegeria sp.]